jgi:hypothetical protein
MRALHRLNHRACLFTILFPQSCRSLADLGGDGLLIIVNNDSSDNLLVTVYDQSTTPPQRVVSRTPIYGNTSISVSITRDSGGHGHLSWTAMTIDHDMRKCGHSDKTNLNDGDTVNVYADDDCTT